MIWISVHLKKKKYRGAPIKQNKTGWVFGGCSTSQLISIRQCDKQRRILSATPETGNLRRDHQLIIRTFVWCRSVPRVEHRRVTKPTAECQKLCRYKQKTKKKRHQRTPEKSFLPLKLYDKYTATALSRFLRTNIWLQLTMKTQLDTSLLTHIHWSSHSSALSAPLSPANWYHEGFHFKCHSFTLTVVCYSMLFGAGRPWLLLITAGNERRDPDCETWGYF